MFEEMIKGIENIAKKERNEVILRRTIFHFIKKYGKKGVLSLNFDDLGIEDHGENVSFKKIEDDGFHSSIKDNKWIFHLKPLEKSFFDKKTTKKTTSKKPSRSTLNKRGRPSKKGK